MTSVAHLQPPQPILVTALFPEVRHRLQTLLAGLTPHEWTLPTAAKDWTVKDVALHLLGGDLGNLSRRRDMFVPPGASISNWEDLVNLVNRLNHSWVEAARRMSPQLLCDLLAYIGPQVEGYFASLDPFALGGPVSWAGPQPAPVWFDLAREYTERWHHQQQICDATGRPGLYEPRLFAPVIDTFVRALPHTFRSVVAPDAVSVQLTILGPAGGHWVLRSEAAVWMLLVGEDFTTAAQVTLAAEDAWKIFTRGLRGQEARTRATIRGDLTLGAQVLETISVIA